ncbi:MAG TPA: hydrolase [Gammaproteobacteria bacterium]|nr:hydrolase [Gammaproteobacteria bacterium]
MTVVTEMLCQAARSQLVVIDVQERLASAMDKKVREHLLDNTARLIQAAGLLEIPVRRTEQYPKGLGPTEPALAELLTEIPTGAPVEKTAFSCCAVDEFNAAVDSSPERHQIVLTGMESHVCVLQTALELQAAGRQVFVVADAVCSRSKANHKNALRRLASAGVVVSNTESVMFEWMRDAKHPQFKAISKLLK